MQASCRPGCGACCTAPSISSPIPGMPFIDGLGKAAGVPCIQLTADLRCALFGLPQRPAVCTSLRPSAEMCGETREHAIAWLTKLDRDTAPQPVHARHRAD
ncbi:MAG: zinc/iron-chelating domain-containing protein [Burkholderiales bacterium PBB1]|nr:MAG: zinc/iron-chelating domain-containing protein [Burkholderiales bacterium PBB1]